MLARHLLLGVLAVCLSLAAADHRDDQLQTSQSTQLLSREKRGVGLSPTGFATIAGGLLGILSVMGLPTLRRRVGQIGELRDFRAVSRPRPILEREESLASQPAAVVTRCVYRLGHTCLYSVRQKSWR